MSSRHHDDWQRIEEILDRALDADPAGRDSVVREACGDDHDLLERVLTLLNAAEASGPLDTPVHELAGSLAAEAGESLTLKRTIEGRLIGPWRVREEIGAGGMGRVFRADRADGAFQQSVALKILRWEMATPALVDRFLAERQILADLDHPGIARLVDGGVTEEGLPYLAMEFVDGEPIDEYCDRENLDIRQRLEFFCTAAMAVDHAHRNLVVHRDLKPSNILTTRSGEVKLLDFGVARLVDDTARDDRTQAPVTPRSAAPEQLRGRAITTATDTWALGVLLYELLTGQTPFGGRETTLTETTRRVLEIDPKPPSAVVSGEARRRIAGDLDNIVLKALSKEPERRYSTVERMVEDVRRHLDGMPVSARPATLGYRAGKFIRRHTASLAAAAMVVVLLAALTGFYTWQLANERDRARQEARKTEEVKDFVLSLFEANDPTLSQGEDIRARDLLDAGAERVETELASQPEIQAEMYSVVANLYEQLGHYEQALELWELAIPLQERGDDPDVLAETLARYGFTLSDMGRADEAEPALREALRIRLEDMDNAEATASSQNQLGMFLAYQGEYDEAIPLLRQSVAIREEIYDGPTPELGVAVANLGLAVKWAGDFDEAEVHYRRALAIREQTVGRMHPDSAVNLDNLGVLLGQRGDYEESEVCFKEALDIRTELLGEEHPDVALSMNNLATLYRVQGRLDEAEPMYRQVLELNTRIFGPDHRRVATNLTNLASVELARGNVEEARELFERSLAIRRQQLGDDHIDVAINLNHLAGILVRLGDLERADRYSAESVDIASEAVGEKSFQLAQCLHIRGEVLYRRGRYEEAKPYLEEALAIREEVLAPDHFETESTRAVLDSTLTRIQR